MTNLKTQVAEALEKTECMSVFKMPGSMKDSVWVECYAELDDVKDTMAFEELFNAALQESAKRLREQED